MTGRGALGQLQLETKLPQQYINYGVLGIVVFNFVTALAPGSPTFSADNQADVKKRPPGPTNKYAPFLFTCEVCMHISDLQAAAAAITIEKSSGATFSKSCRLNCMLPLDVSIACCP